MTICAAAVCEDGRGIVAVCDRMAGQGATSMESILKATRIHGTRWVALIAGEDVGFAPGIMRRVREQLAETQGTPDEVREAFEEQCAYELRSKIRTILSRWQLTIEQLFDPEAAIDKPFRAELIARISAVTLECSFLVCGFGPRLSDEATIFEIGSAGQIREFSEPTSFWAIGAGGRHAIESFVRRGYGPRTKFPVAVYCACEAKFSAENAPGVGRRTWLFLIDPDGVHLQMGETTLMGDIRKSCRRFVPVPSRLTKRIARIIPGRFNEYG